MTSTFEQLLSDQRIISKWIVNFMTNARKVNEQAITVGYLGKWLDTLNGYWDSFLKTHHTLVRFPESDESECNTSHELNEVELILHSFARRDLKDAATAFFPLVPRPRPHLHLKRLRTRSWNK